MKVIRASEQIIDKRLLGGGKLNNIRPSLVELIMKKTILASAILIALSTGAYAETSIHVNSSTDDYLHEEVVSSSNYEKFVVSKDQKGKFDIGGDSTKSISIETDGPIAMFFRNASTAADFTSQTDASKKANEGILNDMEPSFSQSGRIGLTQ